MRQTPLCAFLLVSLGVLSPGVSRPVGVSQDLSSAHFRYRNPLPGFIHAAARKHLIGPAPAALRGLRRGVSRPDTTSRANYEADLLEGKVVDGEEVTVLTGNVKVRQDSTSLWSDQAIQYASRDEFLFVGNVLIEERGDSLQADSILYNELTKVGRAWGNVRLSDGDVVALAPSGIYFTEEKRSLFEEGVTLVDSLSELAARTGTYWSDEKRAELAGAVTLQAERTYLEADSLTYLRETEVSIARGNVFIERLGGEEGTAAEADSTIRTLLFSQRAYHDNQEGLSRLDVQPLVLQLRQDSADAAVDTLILRAQQLEAIDREDLQQMIAVGGVRIWRGDFAAVADSLVYLRFEPATEVSLPDTLLLSPDSLEAPVAVADTVEGLVSPEIEPSASPVGTDWYEETWLYRDPIAWFEASQISGDTIRVTVRDGEIDSLFVYSQAFVAQHDGEVDQINQLQGQDLIGVFEADSVRTFYVEPDAKALYFRKDEDGLLTEAIEVAGDRGVFRFRGDQPRRIAFYPPQGRIYPRDLIPSPLQLDGLQWVPQRRPVKAALLDEAWIVVRLEQYAGETTFKEKVEALLPADSASTETSRQRP